MFLVVIYFQFLCVPCGNVTFVRENLAHRHVTEWHGMFRYQCTYCKKSFARKVLSHAPCRKVRPEDFTIMDQHGNRHNAFERLQDWKRKNLPRMVRQVPNGYIKHLTEVDETYNKAPAPNTVDLRNQLNNIPDLSDISEVDVMSPPRTNKDSQEDDEETSSSSSSSSQSSNSSSSSSSTASSSHSSASPEPEDLTTKDTDSSASDALDLRVIKVSKSIPANMTPVKNDMGDVLSVNENTTDLIGEEQITLNVGGTIFITTRKTLMAFPSLLARRAESNETAIFIDRDPAHFRFILNYPRNKNVDLKTLPGDIRYLWEMFYEAKYYELDGFIQAVEAHIRNVMAKHHYK
ncbi:hypothetical protein DPMN_070522 [Dreissena polymorpha]|uniref:BTB domain-containing protein n=1 Tax=Dreissena polymorpha TaxID=45954 RepID=A0A9D3Z0X3_DREPO|nr:hypothetical protein DPMN_070522 [Dreissena polymorpha]